MSRDDILNMPVGRELDTLVAEKVMGWHDDGSREEVHDSEGRYEGFTQWKDDEGDPAFLRDYSTDISAAADVIQKLGRVKVFCHQQVTKGNYEVCFVENDFDYVMTATYPTLPEAISKAALLAVME